MRSRTILKVLFTVHYIENDIFINLFKSNILDENDPVYNFFFFLPHRRLSIRFNDIKYGI